MGKEGYIKLYRSLLAWEWYDDINTTRLFLHLLLTANYQDKNWRGVMIKRGQRIATIRGLAKETRLSVKQIRTCLIHLKSTQETAQEKTQVGTLITLVNYEKYQGETAQEKTQETAQEGHSKGTDIRKKEVKNKKIKDIGAFSRREDLILVIEQQTQSPEVRQAAIDWLDMRIAKKKPPTPRAIELAFKDLKKWVQYEDEAIAIFNISTMNNWTALYDPNEKKGQRYG